MKHPGEFMLEGCAAAVAILRFAFVFQFHSLRPLRMS